MLSKNKISLVREKMGFVLSEPNECGWFTIKEYQKEHDEDTTDVKIFSYSEILRSEDSLFEETEYSNRKYIIVYKSHKEYLDLLNMSKANRKDIKLCEKLNKKEFNDFIVESTISLFENEKEDIWLHTDTANNLKNSLTAELGVIELSSRVFEIPVMDLINMYDTNSYGLFSANVRIPLSKKKFINILYDEICTIHNLCRKEMYDEEIFTTIELEDLYLVDEPKMYSLFNLKHNGITIAHDGKELFERERIKIMDYENASIINGAQTVSALYENYYNLFNIFKIKYLETNPDIKEDKLNLLVKKNLDLLFYKILINVKLVCYKDINHLHEISFGLNNQTQVSEYDKYIRDSEKVTSKLKEINSSLKIIKSGERKTLLRISLIEFLKLYLISIKKPGEAKNFNLSNISNLIDEISNIGNLKEIVDKMIALQSIGQSYSTKRKLLEEAYNIKYVNFYGYAKNYGLSYAVLSDSFEESLDYLIDEVFKKWQIYSKNNNTEDFQSELKRDDFWEMIDQEYSTQAENQTSDSSVLIEYLEGTKAVSDYEEFSKTHKAKNKNSAFIKEKAKELNCSEILFNTMTANEGIIQESFPISFFNASIARYIMFDADAESYIIKKYQLKAEIAKFKECLNEYEDKKLFIFDFKQNKLNKITVLDFVSVVSNSEQYVEPIIDNIRQNFENETTDFTKLSDNKFFHIRTKAINSEDTIMYSSGEEITKRSVWINKIEIQKIYNEKKD